MTRIQEDIHKLKFTGGVDADGHILEPADLRATSGGAQAIVGPHQPAEVGARCRLARQQATHQRDGLLFCLANGL